MFDTDSDIVILPLRDQLRLPLVRATGVVSAYGKMSDSERIVCALLMMSAQNELNGQGTVNDVVDLVRTHFAPVHPSTAPELGVPDQRRWIAGFDTHQWALRVPPLVRILQSSDPMSAF